MLGRSNKLIAVASSRVVVVFVVVGKMVALPRTIFPGGSVKVQGNRYEVLPPNAFLGYLADKIACELVCES